MDKALSQLIRVSKVVGTDASLVQGGGGNISVKTDDGKYMYIKASGTALKDMNGQKGWRRMRLESVLSVIEDKSLAKLETHARETEVVNRLLLACEDKITAGARPSVEAHLHAFLDKCVIHLHPSAVGAYVNAKNGRAKLERLFAAEKFSPLWVPYTDPGFTLAKRIGKLVGDYQKRFGRKPAILFLEKHGLLVTEGSADATLRLVRKVIRMCNSKLRVLKSGRVKVVSKQRIAETKLCIRRAYFEATGEYAPVSYFFDEAFAAFWSKKGAKKMLAPGALTPDTLLYSNGPAMWVENCGAKRIGSQLGKGTRPSVAFLVKGQGLFVVGSKKMAATVRDVTAYSLFIRFNAARMGGILSLNRRQQEFINQWESEAFRKKLAGGVSEGQLKGRIAVVTGASSGLGRSIAIGLARDAVAVAIVDVDKKAAEQTQEIIENELPQAQTLVVGCDVTKEDDVEESFKTVVDKWGGLDILVNAAGIAPAFSLVDLPVDKWRLAVEVNLTGYMLMAKHAARIMIKQGMGGSIVNLSSKSGLEASKNNTPYNATKAGEIHMARGWALELGEHGIRVNCVAPGNVFEGSKIWNPEYIKVCAKKYGIKPEEVIPYYVCKTALNREIKGQDIADAVIFLCTDKARTITGQTLVADSGQVMVR